jgi:Domain of unknown function (DUF4351)
MPTPHADQDSPWKLILRHYFPDAIQFFFPEIAVQVDWSEPPEFLDKEFQQIAPDAEIGKRYADQLVKVHRLQEKPLFLLLHVEVQAAPERNFAERMFIYSLRIFDQFHQPASSLAILCDSQPDWRPQEYSLKAPGSHHQFGFTVVKLLDYRDRWQELEQDHNPFAMVVMAHLKTQATRRNATDRKEWKLRLIRTLYEKGYSRDDVLSLFKFIDWSMMLPEGLKQAFWEELRAYEQERHMPYITSVEQIGFDRGIQEGRQEGRQEGQRSLVLLLLSQKLGPLSDAIAAKIAALSLEQLAELAIATLDFADRMDLERWVDRQD